MIEPPSPSLFRGSAGAFALLAFAACGGRVSGAGGSGGNVAVSGGASTGTVSGATSGTISVSTSGSTSGAVTSGSVVGSGATVTSSSAGSTSGAGMNGSAGSSSGTVRIPGDAGLDAGNLIGAVPSAGCGKALTVATGTWVSQPTGCAQGINNQGTAECQAIPPGSTVPATATQGSPEFRGWWVYVPTGYDPNKPYTVIYDMAGCFDPNFFDIGRQGYPYDSVDNGQAILVGLDYPTYSDHLGCNDALDPKSNDLIFMPWLMTEIENTFCVDTSKEWMSEYSDNGEDAVAQQFDCAFPAKFRGQVLVGGGEPGATGIPGSLPGPCNPAPMAALFVHDLDDTDGPYGDIIPGCSRILQQNGCATTSCDNLAKFYLSGPPQGLPPNTTLYLPPAGVVLPARSQCVQFDGCPTQYPVVFCTTSNQGDGDDQRWGVVTLLWNFISGLGPTSPPCPVGQGYQNGVCAPCPNGLTACGSTCVNEQADPHNCGGCGNLCSSSPPRICQAGSCKVCEDGETAACGGSCVNEQTDPNNCGICNFVCPVTSDGGPPSCSAGVCAM